MLARLLQAALGLLGKGGAARSDSNLGAHGEQVAYWYLRRLGYTMVARNYRSAGSGGEVDLIGWDGDTLVFVEVKTRCSNDFRHAEDAVDEEKRQHLVAAARDYRHRAHVCAPYRFDVAAVYLAPGREPTVRHFRDAFREANTAWK